VDKQEAAKCVACAGEGRLATTRLPDRHETAHASHGKLCSPLIEEGWATLYSSPFEGCVMEGSLVDVSAAMEEIGRLPGKYYPFAARFLAFVIEGFGIDAVRSLCPMRLRSIAELEAGLQEVLGMSLEETQIALDDYPVWSLGQLRQDQACEIGSSMPVPVMTVLQLGCDSGGVEGLLGRRVWNHINVGYW
jgi:hypothetical protein